MRRIYEYLSKPYQTTNGTMLLIILWLVVIGGLCLTLYIDVLQRHDALVDLYNEHWHFHARVQEIISR